MTEKGKIVRHGTGGFLCPPGHPMHDHCIETNLRRRPENRGGMSLEAAVTCEWLDDATQAAARTVLAIWERTKLPLTDKTVVDWIRQVLGYFKGCYNFRFNSEDKTWDEAGWHAGNLTIDSDLDPMDHLDHHAGVRCIRKYYPDYQPERLDFLRAYWGKKPRRT